MRFNFEILYWLEKLDTMSDMLFKSRYNTTESDKADKNQA